MNTLLTTEGVTDCALCSRGLKYVAKNRVERIRAIAEVLAASDYDIVGLQELWVQSDFQHVRNAVLKNLPYSKYFHSGALGSGLAVFTRYPIVGSSIHPYALNGSPLDVAGGDFFVGKSVTSVILEHPTLGELEVFNTHVSAQLWGCAARHSQPVIFAHLDVRQRWRDRGRVPKSSPYSRCDASRKALSGVS